jgi:deoxyribonuclease IV
MYYYGAHVSTAGGLATAPSNAAALGANAFAMFTKSPRSYLAKELISKEIQAFKNALLDANIEPTQVLVHDNYLINLASDQMENRAKSLASLLQELQRVEALGLHLLNFHPGARLKSDLPSALERVASGMKEVLDQTAYAQLIIELTAGSGSHTGGQFEEVATILEYFKGDDKRVGVCIDTAHIFAAGYDLRTQESYALTMESFGKVIGFGYLKGMHLNDSQKELGSKVDRHASLGQGLIGINAFECIAKDSRLEGIPLILETPQPELWATEIALLRSFT